MFQRFCLLLLAIVGLHAALPVVCSAQYTPTPSFTPRPFATPTPYRELTPEERERQQRDAEQAGRICAAGCGTIVLLALILLVLNIALLIWVARDARARGMDSAVLWMFLVMFTSVVGLVIYLFSRPQGPLVQCPHCGGKRLAASAVCPHCRNA